MTRPTPTVLLSESDVVNLNAIKEKHPSGSPCYKRAAVLLACAEGKQGKEIAKEFHVTPNMVINWRRKFENGGVEALMSVEKPGRRKSLSALEVNPEKDPSDGTVVSSTLTNQQEKTETSKELGTSLSDQASKAPNDVLLEMKEKGAQIIGLFLTATIQILALAIPDTLLAAKRKCITVNTGSTQSQQTAIDDNLGFNLLYSLLCLQHLTPREANASCDATAEAANFVESLRNSLKDTESQLYLVCKTPDSRTLVSEQQLIGQKLSSTEEFISAATIWFKTLEGNSQLADKFSKAINDILDSATSQCAPFTWLVTPEDRTPQTVASSQTLSAQDNELTFIMIYKDGTGRNVTSSKVLRNSVPNNVDFSQCKTIHDVQNFIGEYEQAIIKNSQDIGRNFLEKNIYLGNPSKEIEGSKKKKID